MDILRNYSFIIVALGTIILAMATGIIGSISVLKGKSLIGDAIGHSTYPGIVIAFMLSMEKSPIILLFGAAFAGAISFFLIDIISNNSKIDLDATLAIVLSSFFGLGMVLKSFIQGNPDYAGVSQSGLKNYIFGQASYIMKNDVKIIFIVSIFSILMLIAFYKEIKVYVFDEVYAKTIGINPGLMNTVILIATMLLIITGLKLVGAILISSMLIVPAITALQWTDRFHIMLIIAGVSGGISACIGTYISTAYDGMSTGSTIILIMSFISLLSMLVGPRGMRKMIVRKNMIDFLRYSFISNYQTLLVLLVTAIACSLIGVFLVLRSLSMLADAISHSILLGIVIAYFIVKDISSVYLVFGAALFGIITVFSIESLSKTKLVKNDDAVGIVFPMFFALAVILITKYARNVHLDVDVVLMGEVIMAPLNTMNFFGYEIPKSLLKCL